jgi:hypothetical protein
MSGRPRFIRTHSYWLDRGLDFNQSSMSARFPIGSAGVLIETWLTPYVGIRWFAWDVFEIGTLSCALAEWKM